MDNEMTGSWGVAKDGVHYVVENDELRLVDSESGYVASESELPKYADKAPGFLAIQYGFVHMWQLGPSGNWISIV